MTTQITKLNSNVIVVKTSSVKVLDYIAENYGSGLDYVQNTANEFILYGVKCINALLKDTMILAC